MIEKGRVGGSLGGGDESPLPLNIGQFPKLNGLNPNFVSEIKSKIVFFFSKKKKLQIKAIINDSI